MTQATRAGGRRQASAVLFDLDGTLVDNLDALARGYTATIARLGGPALDPPDLLAAWHLGPAEAVLRHFLSRAPTDDDLRLLLKEIDAALATATAYRGVPELLDQLARLNVPLGVVTGATRSLAAASLKAAGLTRSIDVLVAGDEVARPKPAPDGLLAACELLGVAPAQAAYVGDAEVDLMCAAAAGALPVHARWGGHPAIRGDGHGLHAADPAAVLDLLGLREAAR